MEETDRASVGGGGGVESATRLPSNNPPCGKKDRGKPRTGGGGGEVEPGVRRRC